METYNNGDFSSWHFAALRIMSLRDGARNEYWKGVFDKRYGFHKYSFVYFEGADRLLEKSLDPSRGSYPNLGFSGRNNCGLDSFLTHCVSNQWRSIIRCKSHRSRANTSSLNGKDQQARNHFQVIRQRIIALVASGKVNDRYFAAYALELLKCYEQGLHFTQESNSADKYLDSHFMKTRLDNNGIELTISHIDWLAMQLKNHLLERPSE